MSNRSRLPFAEAWTPEFQKRLNDALEERFKVLNEFALVPYGGTQGQALVKKTDRPYELEWGDAVGGAPDWATCAEADAGVVTTKAINPEVGACSYDRKRAWGQHEAGKGTATVTLTDGATITVDCRLSNVFAVTLGGNRTLASPTNQIEGQTINIKIRQDGTGGRTLAWPSDFLFVGGFEPALSTAPNCVDMVSMQWDETDAKWYGTFLPDFTGTGSGAVALPPGPEGPPGSAILSGTAAPGAEDGDDGDYYFRTSTSDFYGPKVGSSWGSPTNLKGATGLTGPAGVVQAVVAGSNISVNNADPANPVVAVTGLGDVIDPKNGFAISDDFIILGGGVGPWPWDTNTSGTGAAVTSPQGEANAPGIMRFDAGTTTTGQAAATYGNTNATTAHRPVVVGGGEIVMEARVRVSAAANGTDQYFARIGLVDELSGAPGDGIYFGTVASTGVWQYTCRAIAASATFTNDAGAAAISTSWTHIKLVINAAGTSVEFFVDGASKATITTDIPLVGMTLGVGIQKSAGTASRSLDIDFIKLKQTFTAPRWA